MSYFENKRIQINSLATDATDIDQNELSVLYVTPLLINEEQKRFIQTKYSEMIFSDSSGSNNILSYCSLDKEKTELSFLSKFMQELYNFGQFFNMIRTNIKSVTTVHLFLFTSVSFLFQIVPLLILGKFYRKSVIVELFDLNNYYYPEESRTIPRYFLKLADCLIVPSRHQSRALRHKRIQAVTLKEQVNFDNITSRIIEEVQPLILVSTYFEDVFNLNCLLKAFKLVKQKYPRAELILSGSGSQKDNIANMVSVKSISGVSVLSSEEAKEFFGEADIFVHCYHVEYFAQEILQAMANGIPVIASPVGMVNKLIQNENILMYQFNDFSTLADNLLLLIENDSLPIELSVNGAKFAKEYLIAQPSNSLRTFYKNFS